MADIRRRALSCSNSANHCHKTRHKPKRTQSTIATQAGRYLAAVTCFSHLHFPRRIQPQTLQKSQIYLCLSWLCADENPVDCGRMEMGWKFSLATIFFFEKSFDISVTCRASFVWVYSWEKFPTIFHLHLRSTCTSYNPDFIRNSLNGVSFLY